MKRKLILSAVAVAAIVAIPLILTPTVDAAKKPKYLGYKKGCGCHKSQKDSWLKTTHANAFALLKPNAKVEAKKKAKLDPKKDYTEDRKCLPCHTTGYGKPGGYRTGLPEAKAQYLVGVTCEECHGPGSLYRKEHKKAGKKFKKSKKKTDRKRLVKAGQNFDYKEACAKCHLNYEGSPWKKAKKPYTPFTPDVDPEYAFDFEKAVRDIGDGKAMHEHFKLRGVFTGGPVPEFRAEFQKSAKEPARSEGE